MAIVGGRGKKTILSIGNRPYLWRTIKYKRKTMNLDTQHRIPEHQLPDFIPSAWLLLTQDKRTLYAQKTIAMKLSAVGYPVAESTLTKLGKLLSGRLSLDAFHAATLQRLAHGLHEVLNKELCLRWDAEALSFVAIDGCAPAVVPIDEAGEKLTVKLHLEGRLPIRQKVDFIEAAQEEVIELGVRLHSFAQYFTRRSHSEYARHVVSALNRGVNFHLYIASPEGRFTSDYFQDRARVMPSEWDDFQEMAAVQRQLSELCRELNSQSGPGQMHLYKYSAFPYGYAQVIDSGRPGARLRYMPYLYGVSRANCPVWEVEKQRDRAFYNKLWQSVKAIITQSKPVL